MQIKRFELRASDANNNMTIDLVVDSKNVARGGMPFCGWWGRLKSSEVWPFVLLADGRVDFGSDEDTDPSDRFGHLNLHGRSLETGAYVTYKDEEQEILFRVGPGVDLLD